MIRPALANGEQGERNGGSTKGRKREKKKSCEEKLGNRK